MRHSLTVVNFIVRRCGEWCLFKKIKTKVYVHTKCVNCIFSVLEAYMVETAECVTLSASANAVLRLTVAVWGTVTVTFMTTETLLNMHAQAFIHISLCAHWMHTHVPCVCVCSWNTSIVPMLGFARDKEPRCEVWNVYLSRQYAVSVWGCSEWEMEMARRHHTAVQADFAKACLSPKLSPQHLCHLSTSQRLRSL